MVMQGWLPHWLLQLDREELRTSEFRAVIFIVANILTLHPGASWDAETASPRSAPLRAKDFPGKLRSAQGALARLIERGILEQTHEHHDYYRYAFPALKPAAPATGPPGPDSTKAPAPQVPPHDPLVSSLCGDQPETYGSSLLYPKRKTKRKGLRSVADDPAAETQTTPPEEA